MRLEKPLSSTVITAERREVAYPNSCIVYFVSITGMFLSSDSQALLNSVLSLSDASDERRQSLACECLIADSAASWPQLNFLARCAIPKRFKTLSLGILLHLLFHSIINFLRNFAFELTLKAM